MLEKEKITQGIYLDLEDNNKYWVENRNHAEIFKNYETVEDLTKNPRFKKIGENTIAHSENLTENSLGVEDVVQDFNFLELAFPKEKYDYFEFLDGSMLYHLKKIKKEVLVNDEFDERDDMFLKFLENLE